jgi:myo-inositol catabolism protein IolC
MTNASSLREVPREEHIPELRCSFFYWPEDQNELRRETAADVA